MTISRFTSPAAGVDGVTKLFLRHIVSAFGVSGAASVFARAESLRPDASVRVDDGRGGVVEALS